MTTITHEAILSDGSRLNLEISQPRPNPEAWTLVRNCRPELEPLMSAPTVGELKRVMATDEARDIRHECLARVGGWQDFMLASDRSQRASVHLNRRALNDMEDHEPLPMSDDVWSKQGFKAWLLDLALRAQVQVNSCM